MAKIIINKDILTLKDYILSNYNQVRVFTKYIQTDINTLTENKLKYYIDNSIRINNPFRNDEHPSLSFYYSTANKLIAYDYANALYRGDLFDVVAWKLGLSSNNSRNFVDICKHIIANVEKGDIDKTVIFTEKSIQTISVRIRKWTKYDIHYWGLGGVNVFKQSSVLPVYEAYENDKKLFVHMKDNNPCYSYYKGQDLDTDKALHKLYIPNATKGNSKFYTNNKLPIDLRGFFGGKLVIVTKSDKDKLVVEASIERLRPMHLSSIGFKQENIIHVGNVNSESTFISKELMEYLLNYYENVILNLDFDRVGLIAGYYYKKVFNVNTIYIGNTYDYKTFPQKDLMKLFEKIKKDTDIKILHTTDFNKFVKSSIGNSDMKDFYDYCRKYGVEKLDKLLLNKIKRYVK